MVVGLRVVPQASTSQFRIVTSLFFTADYFSPYMKALFHFHLTDGQDVVMQLYRLRKLSSLPLMWFVLDWLRHQSPVGPRSCMACHRSLSWKRPRLLPRERESSGFLFQLHADSLLFMSCYEGITVRLWLPPALPVTAAEESLWMICYGKRCSHKTIPFRISRSLSGCAQFLTLNLAISYRYFSFLHSGLFSPYSKVFSFSHNNRRTRRSDATI